jgi:Mrp family chromosome partitioning ATPase
MGRLRSLRQNCMALVGLQGLDRTFREGRAAGEALFQRGTLSAYWDRLSAATDLILLDTPSAVRSASGLAVAPTADGVVLVIEANRSGYATVRRAKEDIERSGGHVLGVVLNKKRRYLPRFLERWV